MGAAHGKSKKELKEEAQEWAKTKENEVAELYEQNTQLRNQIMMMQVDIQAFRDMLKGQQSALNETVKQMEERMTEMENDVKVVPFENGKPVSLGTDREQEVYYRRFIPSETAVCHKDKHFTDYTENIAMVGRVYSLKQFEKVYINDHKYKKTNRNEQCERESRCLKEGPQIGGILNGQMGTPIPHTSRGVYWPHFHPEPEL